MADWLKHAAVPDFETLPIDGRPRYPPMPVGVALRVPGRKTRYYSWAHPSGNNSTWEEARAALGAVWESERPVLNHNLLAFDHDVAVEHMELPPLSWERQHDTIPMLFLNDPRAPDYRLKPTAERLLGLAPDERDAVVARLIADQPVPGKRLTPSSASAYIALAPGDVVGAYAVGDVDRAYDVAVHQYKELERRGMVAAYDRERELSPVLREMEAQGVRVDLGRLEADVTSYARWLEQLEAWMRKRLGVGEDFNFDSGQQLAQALLAAGLATEAGLGRTATGQVQTNKAALEAGVTDAQLLAALRYRGTLGTCLETFMGPWLKTAQASGGFIYTSWHSTRDDRDAGARTGRLSSTPNFQNLVNTLIAFFAQHAATSAERKLKPACPVRGLPPLPQVRSYIVPYETGHVLIGRDAASQEPRVLAHYEGGAVLEAYLADPWIDYHGEAQRKLLDFNIELPRKSVKIINLALIYGMGVGLMAEKTGLSVAETTAAKKAILMAYPGLRQLIQDLKERARAGRPIRTWGGREYFCEPAKWIDGQLRDFAYKMLNLLVQGSAADHIKVAMIAYGKAKKRGHRLLMTVHDELLASVPRAERDSGMAILKRSMEDVKFDVPMLSEGAWSDESWAAMQPYDQKGRLVAAAA